MAVGDSEENVRMSTIARFVLRHPRKILSFWVVVLLISGVGATRLSGRVQNGGYAASGSGRSGPVKSQEQQFGPISEPQAYLSVLAQHGSHGLDRREVVQAAAAVRGVEGVKLLGAPVISADGQAALLPVTFAGSYGYAQTRVPAVETALARARLASSTARLVGQVGIYQRYMVNSKKSLSTSSLISFPVTLVILLVAFLSVVAALLPLGLAAVCVGVTFGFLYLLTYVVQLSVFVEDTVLILGLGLSIDFSLFMVTRVRESLAREGATMEQAITEALQTTGRAITVSGLTVATALAGLYVTGLGVFSSLATGAIGAALIAVSAALTLTPAAIVLLGDRLDRFSIRRAVDGRPERRLLAQARRLRRAPARGGRSR